MTEDWPSARMPMTILATIHFEAATYIRDIACVSMQIS